MGSSMVTMWSARVCVDLVDDGGQGGRLARAGRPGDQHEPARLVAEGVQDLGQPEFIDGLDVHRDEPEGRGERPLVEEDVDTEAGLAVQRVGEVDLPVGLELLPLVLVQDAVDELARLVGRQLRIAFEVLQVAVDAHHRRHPDRQMEVRRLGLDDLSEDLAYIHGLLSLVTRVASRDHTMTREISSMLVTPCSTRSSPSCAKRHHALGSRHSPYLIGTLALDDESLDGLGDQHDLVDAHPALVAGVVAARAARPRGRA